MTKCAKITQNTDERRPVLPPPPGKECLPARAALQNPLVNEVSPGLNWGVLFDNAAVKAASNFEGRNNNKNPSVSLVHGMAPVPTLPLRF